MVDRVLNTPLPTNTPRVFHVETTWNARGVFVGLRTSRRFSVTVKVPVVHEKNAARNI